MNLLDPFALCFVGWFAIHDSYTRTLIRSSRWWYDDDRIGGGVWHSLMIRVIRLLPPLWHLELPYSDTSLWLIELSPQSVGRRSWRCAGDSCSPAPVPTPTPILLTGRPRRSRRERQSNHLHTRGPSISRGSEPLLLISVRWDNRISILRIIEIMIGRCKKNSIQKNKTRD
jgi:hypothetical protein